MTPDDTIAGHRFAAAASAMRPAGGGKLAVTPGAARKATGSERTRLAVAATFQGRPDHAAAAADRYRRSSAALRLRRLLSRNRRSCTRVLASLCLVPLFGAVTARAELPDVYRAFEAGDCKAIGESVNRGLDANDPEALFYAGLLYDDTECVADDPVKAGRFYQRAVDGGFADARDALGMLSALGRGVPQDYAAAYRWYSRDAADPLAAESTRAGAMGYAITLARLARLRARYPLVAEQIGIEASLDAIVDPATREVTFANAKAGAEVGSNVGKTGPFVESVRSGYAAALERAPRLEPVASGQRFRTPWRFAMRRGRLDQKVQGEGTITIGLTEVVTGRTAP